MTCPVPEAVESGEDRVTIARAWPTTRGRLRFEGTDGQGLVRAGTTTVGPSPQVSILPHGVDRKLPDLHPVMPDGELVVHRAGKRAVVRHADRYLKVVRPGGAAALAEAAEHGRRRASLAGMLAPEVVEVADGWLSTTTVGGVALHAAAQTATPAQWRMWWGAWAGQWPALVTTDQHGLTEFTAVDEVAVLRAGVDRALAWGALPDPTGRGRERTDEVCRTLLDVTGPPVGVAHRDLHDKQLLAGPCGIGVLDFDTACVAEPALDLANLAVHARWRTAQGLWSRGQADVVVWAARRVGRALEVPEERWAAYAAGTALRLAALYAFRPRWSPVALAWWDAQMRGLS